MNSIKLVAEQVKQVRDLRGISQESLAESVGVATRTIQRIEDAHAAYKTKHNVAELVARVLAVSINTLLPTPDRPTYSWLVMRDGEPTKLIHDISSVIKEEIIASSMPFDCLKPDDVTLYLQTKELPWSVTIEHHFESTSSNSERTWSFRPVCHDEECGLVWVKPTFIEELMWMSAVATLCYDTAYDVFIDSHPLIPGDREHHYLVLFHSKIGQSENLVHGYQLFNDDSDLAISLGSWLSERQRKVNAHQEYATGKLCLEMYSKDSSGIDIYKVWSKGDGTFERAPWVDKHKNQLEDSINQRKLDDVGPVRMAYSAPMTYKKFITPMIPAISGSPVICARFGYKENKVND